MPLINIYGLELEYVLGVWEFLSKIAYSFTGLFLKKAFNRIIMQLSALVLKEDNSLPY